MAPAALPLPRGHGGRSQGGNGFRQESGCAEVRGGLMKRTGHRADGWRAGTPPSREELLAKMLGSMQSPATNLVGVLNGVARSLAFVLQARAEQLQQAEGA